MDYGNSGSGYMDASFDGSNKSDSAGFTRKPMGEQTLRPLTIKQIKNCTIPQDHMFRVDGADVTQCTIVGIIRNIQELATNYIYTIEDGTGAIEVRRWIESNEHPDEAEARRALMVNTYVRVSGKLNSFASRVSIISHTMKPITDFNELTYHMLDTIETHLRFAKPKNGSAMDIDSNSSKSKSITDHVHETIQELGPGVDGCSVEQVVFKLKGLFQEHEVREAIESLENDGALYATIDSEHIKSCAP